jgi:hypothetical protein
MKQRVGSPDIARAQQGKAVADYGIEVIGAKPPDQLELPYRLGQRIGAVRSPAMLESRSPRWWAGSLRLEEAWSQEEVTGQETCAGQLHGLYVQ